jgi:DNA polymerase/3'-5' exonuclease PolX
MISQISGQKSSSSTALMEKIIKCKEQISRSKILEEVQFNVHILNHMKKIGSIKRCPVAFICMAILVVEWKP